MEKTWKAAIIRVLRESSTPLRYAEITDRILENGYFKSDGATPAATVNAKITESIKNDGEKSLFIRVDRGVVALKNWSSDMPSGIGKTKATATKSEADSSDSIISSFGIYWQRERVVWCRNAKIYGKQQAQSKPVDFAKQQGIYILYDRHTVVYVGRSIELGKRLYQHTIGRLNSRWDRFSWFGLLGVANDGKLEEATTDTSLDSLLATLEAVLIEALEPPQNRQQGENFAGIEYIQDDDPELQRKKHRKFIQEIREKI